MGWRGRRTWWVLIPFVALIWLFKPGTKDTNLYGPPPPPNTLGIYVLAWLLPGIMAIGIVAAIALPAYQDYAKRARTSQVSR